MKKIIMIVAFVACLPIYGCGSGPSTTIYDCKSDRDCSDDYYCIDRVCVFNPQCETDEDCPEDEICNAEYQCANFWDDDTCLGEACSANPEDPSDCAECGLYTGCADGECINACNAYYIKYMVKTAERCLSIDDCKVCICTSQGLRTVTEGCGQALNDECATASPVTLASFHDKILDFTSGMATINTLLGIHCGI